MQDPALRRTIIEAYTRSISTIWIVMTPVVGVSFVMGECGDHLFRVYLTQGLHSSVVLEKVHPEADHCEGWGRREWEWGIDTDQ